MALTVSRRCPGRAVRVRSASSAALPRTGLPVFLGDPQLNGLYRRTPGGAVSFIDESYRTWVGAGRP